MSGLITTKGKNISLDRIYNAGTYSEIKYIQLGMCAKAPIITDTKVFAPIPTETSGNATIDACDATTGWSASGDGTGVVLNTTAGDRLEGTGSLNLEATFSSGVATYYKTLSSFVGTDDYLFIAFYANSLTSLVNTTDTIQIELGTGGFTNTNIYDFNYSQLQTGWNAIVCKIDTPTSTNGTGATIATIDRIRINIKINTDLADDDLIMDYIHTYPEANTYITWESGYPTLNETTKTATTRFILNSLQANSYILREFGVFDDTKAYLYRRDKYTSITKTQYITLTFDIVDKIN